MQTVIEHGRKVYTVSIMLNECIFALIVLFV